VSNLEEELIYRECAACLQTTASPRRQECGRRAAGFAAHQLRIIIINCVHAIIGQSWNGVTVMQEDCIEDLAAMEWNGRSTTRDERGRYSLKQM